MTKSEYLLGVMQRMNELGWDDSLSGMFLGSDTTKVERQIEATFRDAWRKAVGAFSKSYFNQKSFVSSLLHGDVSTGAGFVVLPLDFYLLVRFGMKGWKKDCYIALEMDDVIGAIQANEYVRGNYLRPACTLDNDPKYGQVLRYYSLPKGDEHIVETALYIPLVSRIEGLSDNDDLLLNEELYEPLQWLNAGMVFAVFEKSDAAKMAEERAVSITNYELRITK